MTDHQWPHDASADDRWIYAEVDVDHATAASPESAEWLAYWMPPEYLRFDQ